MSAADKIKNTAQDLRGKAKETAGRATGDDRLVADGKADQTEAKIRRKATDVKEVFTKK